MKKPGDVIASLFLILIGLGGILGAIKYRLGTLMQPRAGFFPFISGLILIGLSSVLLVQAWQGHSLGTKALGKLGRPAIVVLGMVVYVMVFDLVGYLITALMLSAIVLYVLETRPWWVLVGVSLALSVGSYILFDRLLGVTLPRGILEELL